MGDESPSIAEQAYQTYPRLLSYGFQFMDSRGAPDAGERMSETYPADESDNPMPGKPTIQQFSPDMKPQDFLGETLHILPKVDSFVGAARDQFVKSMTPEQQKQMMEQYDYAKQHEGETRSFQKWRDMSGTDAWFRGHISGQWPSSMYTPEQIKIFGAVDQYLRQPPE